MADYIFLMHDDADVSDHTWEPYILHLQERGVFQGGSTVGDGLCARKDGAARLVTEHLTGVHPDHCRQHGTSEIPANRQSAI